MSAKDWKETLLENVAQAVVDERWDWSGTMAFADRRKNDAWLEQVRLMRAVLRRKLLPILEAGATYYDMSCGSCRARKEAIDAAKQAALEGKS